MTKNLLVVEAHPDDVEWYAGGTIARLALAGADITLVICTEGDRGSYNPDDNPATLAATRKREQQAAADLLGVKTVLYLGYSDGSLQPTLELRERLAILYRRYRPDILLAFDPWKRYELHPDHLAAGRAALDARIASKMPLYYPETRAEGYESWAIPELWLFNADEPNYFVDVTATFERQIEALRWHSSQNVYGEDSVRYLAENATRAGQTAGCHYAEAFHRITFEGAIAKSG